MNILILLVAMSMTGLMAGRLEACYKPQSLLPEKLLPKLGTVGCIVNPKPLIHFYKTASHLFAEEQDGGFCLYRKIQSLRPSKRPLFKLAYYRFYKSMNADESSGEFFHQRPVPEKTTKRKFGVSYEVTSIETVEKLKNRGKQVTGKSVSIDDVATALEQEFADSSEAQYASGVASYVLSGKAAITAIGPSICFLGKGLNCKAPQQSPKSVLLKRVVDTIIETAETSEDSASCAKQSQI